MDILNDLLEEADTPKKEAAPNTQKKGVVHKLLGHGIRTSVCGNQSPSSSMSYRWKNVTCSKCLSVKGKDFTK